MRTQTHLRLLLGLALAVTMSACGGGSDASDVASAAVDTAGDEVAENGNIVEVATAAGTFNTLVAAVQAAGLVETLSGEGPFTVFAPTDDAFAALPEGTVANLLLPENRDQLVAVLTYHVVAGAVTSEQVIGLTSATTVQGSDVSIAVEGSEVRVGTATVVQTDIEASNGVIHVIDSVLLPPSE